MKSNFTANLYKTIKPKIWEVMVESTEGWFE